MNGVNLRLASLKGACLRSCNLRYAIMAGTDMEVYNHLVQLPPNVGKVPLFVQLILDSESWVFCFSYEYFSETV